MDTPITPEQTAPKATPVPQESPEPVNTATTSSTQKPEAAEAPTSSQDAPEEAQEAPEPQPPKPRKARLRRAQQRRRLHNVILAGVFLLFLLVCFIVNLAVKDRDFSETENRNLAQKPAFSLTALTDGSYFSGLSSYTSDQFFARDNWMSLKLKCETIMGRKDASGIFLGSDDYLLSAPETPNDEALSRTIANINQFAADHSDLSMRMMLVPDSAMILSDKLPKHAPVRDQLQDIKNISGQLSGSVQLLDAASALMPHASEYIYYKTDHHWTSLGAYYAFSACSGQLGIASPVTDYDIYTVSDTFEGTLSSKSGSHKTTDTVQVYIPQSQIRYYVTYSDSTQRVCSIYQSSALESKDKYTVFFGGNHPKVEISTTANNQRVLLLFKDSYANSFVQFLLPYYQKIIMIDPRYYYDNLDSILTTENVTDVLFLYSADTFVKDTSLNDVLEVTGQPQEGTLNTAEDTPQPAQADVSTQESSEVSSEESADTSAAPDSTSPNPSSEATDTP